jgi:hypothetical protein
MQILVEFEDGKLRFRPDPAVVKCGEPVSWWVNRIDPKIESPHLQLVVYFGDRGPFGGNGQVYGLDRPGDRRGALRTDPRAAADPGEYKYGARLVDRARNLTLGDEDPRLIVRSR